MSADNKSIRWQWRYVSFALSGRIARKQIDAGKEMKRLSDMCTGCR